MKTRLQFDGIENKYDLTNEMKEFHVERIPLGKARGMTDVEVASLKDYGGGGLSGHGKSSGSIGGGVSGGISSGGTPPTTRYVCDIFYLKSMEKEYIQLLDDDSLVDEDSLKDIIFYIISGESISDLQIIYSSFCSEKEIPAMIFTDTITGNRSGMIKLAGLSVQDVKSVIKAALANANREDIFFASGAARKEADRLLNLHKLDNNRDNVKVVVNSEFVDILDILKVPLGENPPKYRSVLVFPYDEEEQYKELISGNFKKELSKMSDEYFTIFYSKELLTYEILKAKVLPDLTADNLPCLYFWETRNMDNHQLIELEDLDNHQIARVVRRIRTAFEEEDNLQRAANRAREKVRALLQKTRSIIL